MRYASILSSAVLLLASTGVASAQQARPLANPEPAASNYNARPDSAQGRLTQTRFPAQLTSLTLGYRGLWAEGDGARWQRFRDLREGVRLGGSFSRKTPQSVLQFSAANVTFRDQQYAGEYNAFGKLRVSGLWNSIPLNYGFSTMTPWKHVGGNVWTLDPAARLAVQNKTAIGIIASVADIDKASIYRGLATPLEMQSRRDILSLGVKYRLTEAVGLNLAVNSTKRLGKQPFGGSFAFSAATEHPMALDDRTNEVTAAVEWAKPKAGMVRVEWLGSWYKNQFLSLTWDNPLRAWDYFNAKAPPYGPYDPSGYSNGNGAAFSRMALPPSNSMNTFSIVGLRKLPLRSTLNAQFSFAIGKQNEELIPWTTNTVIMSPTVYAAFPKLASLPRPTAEAELRSINALLNLTTRPSRYLAFEARYRYNDRHNRTPMFDGSEYVRFDAVPEETEHGESRYFDITRNTLETAATVTAVRNVSLKLGYILDDATRTGRIYRGIQDNTFRAALDFFGNRYLMLRGVYEKTQRSGRGLSEEAIETGEVQPATRYYDEAPLDRNRGTVILQLTPTDKFDLGFSLAAGKDEYTGEGHEFGLLDNSNQSYNFTLNVYPVSWVSFSGNYGYEKFSALQQSRNANPPTTTPGAYDSWTDPNRNWSVDNDETVKNLGLFLDVIKALPRTDFRIGYSRSESDNAYVFTGPRIQELSTNVALTPGAPAPCSGGVTSCFEQFAPITNNWQQLRVSVTHMFNLTLGVSAGYSYEKLDIVDFATVNLADGSPRTDPLGALTTGYGNRPYNGHTFMMQVIYLAGPGRVF